MDEREWLNAADPQEMMREWDKGPVSARKLRLAACAFTRRVFHFLTDQHSRNAVELAERWADGRATHAEMGRAADLLEEARTPEGGGLPTGTNADVAAHRTAQINGSEAPDLSAAYEAALYASRATATGEEREDGTCPAESSAQAHLLRDILGNPFRPVALAPGWRTPTVLALAQAAYDNRTLPAGTLEPERLAVLADALEEAGCDDADILGHLRGTGPHVRGCHIIDLLLCKE